MESRSRYRSTIVMSEPLQQSIDSLYAHPYTVAFMRFNRRSDAPIVVTDQLQDQMEEDGMELENRGFITPAYFTSTDQEVFEIYQDHDIHLSESDPHTEQELLDCILILSLRELAFEVDFETFCNLRIRVPRFFDDYDYVIDDNESDSSGNYIGSDYSDDENPGDSAHDPIEPWMVQRYTEIVQYAMDEVQAYQRRQHEVREALEHEDKCCICLENFPNATFVGCMKEGTCCCRCASEIIYNGMKCPHCRAPVQHYTAGPL